MAEFSFKNIFLAGVGATAYSFEKAQELVDDLVKKGELTVQQGKVVNEELKHNMSQKLRSAADSIEGVKAGEGAEEAAAESAGDLLDQVDAMTAEQRQALKEKLEQLEKEDKPWRSSGRAKRRSRSSGAQKRTAAACMRSSRSCAATTLSMA